MPDAVLQPAPVRTNTRRCAAIHWRSRANSADRVIMAIVARHGSYGCQARDNRRRWECDEGALPARRRRRPARPHVTCVLAQQLGELLLHRRAPDVVALRDRMQEIGAERVGQELAALVEELAADVHEEDVLLIV